MKAFILDRYGSAERVRAGDRPDPEPREDDVLVQIHADFADVLRDDDVVLNSLDKVALEKSLRVLKPGGQLISISGPTRCGLCAKHRDVRRSVIGLHSIRRGPWSPLRDRVLQSRLTASRAYCR